MEKDAKKGPDEENRLNVPLPWAYRLTLRALHREAGEVLKQDFGIKNQSTEEKQGSN